MAVWNLLLIVFGAGAIGGGINALMSDNGFALPNRDIGILRPGWIGNALIGGVASAVSWCLYGSSAGISITAMTSEGKGELTLAAFGGAVLVGMGGARWLSSEVDKSLLRAAAIESAKKPPSDKTLAALSIGTPAEAFEAAKLSE